MAMPQKAPDSTIGCRARASGAGHAAYPARGRSGRTFDPAQHSRRGGAGQYRDGNAHPANPPQPRSPDYATPAARASYSGSDGRDSLPRPARHGWRTLSGVHGADELRRQAPGGVPVRRGQAGVRQVPGALLRAGAARAGAHDHALRRSAHDVAPSVAGARARARQAHSGSGQADERCAASRPCASDALAPRGMTFNRCGPMHKARRGPSAHAPRLAHERSHNGRVSSRSTGRRCGASSSQAARGQSAAPTRLCAK